MLSILEFHLGMRSIISGTNGSRDEKWVPQPGGYNAIKGGVQPFGDELLHAMGISTGEFRAGKSN